MKMEMRATQPCGKQCWRMTRAVAAVLPYSICNHLGCAGCCTNQSDQEGTCESSTTRCCHATIQAFLLLFLTDPERPLPPAAQAKKPPGAAFFLGLCEDPLLEGLKTCTPGGGGGPPTTPGGGGGGGGIAIPGGGGGTIITWGSGMTIGFLLLPLEIFFPDLEGRIPGGACMAMKC